MRFKKIILFTILTILVVFVGSVLTFFYFAKEIHSSNQKLINSFNPSSEAGRIRIETERRIDEKLKYEIGGEQYVKEKKFDLAILEFSKINDEWSRHWYLEYVYDKAGKYDEALKEIAWLKKNENRGYVLDDLNKKEAFLRQKIKELRQ